MFPPAVASRDLNVKLFFLFDFAQCAQWMEVTGSNKEPCTDFLEREARVFRFVLMGCELFF